VLAPGDAISFQLATYSGDGGMHQPRDAVAADCVTMVGWEGETPVPEFVREAKAAVVFLKSTEKIRIRGDGPPNKALQAILRAFKNPASKQVERAISRRGSVIVSRWRDDDTIPRGRAFTTNGRSSFPLKGLVGVRWVEDQVYISKRELSTAKAKELLRAFGHMIERTEQSFGNISIDEQAVSTASPDGVRVLGPTISGKLASRSVWHIFLIREGGSWKVWRLEETAS
jgi:hypothetical protein